MAFDFLWRARCRSFHELNLDSISPHFLLLFFLSNLILLSFKTIGNVEDLFQSDRFFIINVVIALSRVRSLLYYLLHQIHKHAGGHVINLWYHRLLWLLVCLLGCHFFGVWKESYMASLETLVEHYLKEVLSINNRH
jgi:hypothetical protein